MNVVSSAGILAAFAFFIPAALIIIYRLAVNRYLLALSVYFFLTGLYNLMAEKVIPASAGVQQSTGLITNYLDAPLLLFSLLFFCTTKRQQTALQVTLISFIVYECIITIAFGFTINALVFILGPGILLIFLFAVYFFVRYARIAIEKNKQVGKTLMLSALTFAYGCYAMIYCFHYIQKDSAQADVFLLYYIASIIAALIMSTGLLWISRRSIKIKEVQTTRRELALFFNR